MSASDKSLQRVLLIAAILGIALSVAFWLAFAWRIGGNISHDPTDWADFGSYIGGTSTALLSLLSLLAVLYTIHVQTSVLRRSTVAQELATRHSRLDALVALHDHYSRAFQHQMKLAEMLQGMSGATLAHDRCAKLDTQLREVDAEIFKYHQELLSSGGG